MQFPIYSIAVYKNWVVIGGGGGKGIANRMEVYDLNAPGDIQAN